MSTGLVEVADAPRVKVGERDGEVPGLMLKKGKY